MAGTRTPKRSKRKSKLARGSAGCDGGGRGDVIEEPTVLVPRDDQERAFPMGRVAQRFVNGAYELVAGAHGRGGMLIARGSQFDVAVVGFDERIGGELPLLGVGDERVEELEMPRRGRKGEAR